MVYEVYNTLRSHFKTIFQLKQIKLESGETPTQRPRQHCLSETVLEMENAYIKITRVKNNWKRFQLAMCGGDICFSLWYRTVLIVGYLEEDSFCSLFLYF